MWGKRIIILLFSLAVFAGLTIALVNILENRRAETNAPTLAVLGSATSTAEAVVVDPQTAAPVVASSWQQGKIAYVARNASKTYFLYTLDFSQDKQPKVLLTPESPKESRYYAPWFAPDGQGLIFDDLYLGRIFFMNVVPAGSPHQSGKCASASFAPDGRRVICYVGGADYFPVYDIESGEMIDKINHGISGAVLPAWSPTGSEIAFAVVEEDRKTSIWKMNTNGGNPIPLAVDAFESYTPAWSPDGEWIAFQSTLTSEKSEIWIMRRDGSDRKQVTFSGGGTNWSRGPCFSPDGQWLAFVSNQAGSDGPDFGDVFVVSLLTGELHQITETGGYVLDWRVTWGR